MGVHQSTVNFGNLIRDLAEMYPLDVPEVVVVELIANALDAQATRISLDYDSKHKILTVADNGSGMTRRQFEEYHDFAAGLKVRGTGIGFAGLGAKISFNVADRVITETKGKEFSGGSDWYLQSKKSLEWTDVRPTHVRSHGTRVEVRFKSATGMPYQSTEDLQTLVRRHYLPLTDPEFLKLYEDMDIYSSDFRFTVNGRTIKPSASEDAFELANVKRFPLRIGRKEVGCGILGLAAHEYPIAPDICGVLICTFGKVIKAEMFNQFFGESAARVCGIVEVPELAQFLTTTKTDFHRQGRHRAFEQLFNPIREEFRAWLKEAGLESRDMPDEGEGSKLEREMKKLIDEIPELAEFFGFRQRTDIPKADARGSGRAEGVQGAELTFPAGSGRRGGGIAPLDVGDGPGEALVDRADGGVRTTPISRTARRGPRIGFSAAPERADLAWVEGNTVTINSAHPAYIKNRAGTPARRLHNIFAIATAIQRFLAAGGEDHDALFVDRMMAAWGKR